MEKELKVQRKTASRVQKAASHRPLTAGLGTDRDRDRARREKDSGQQKKD